MNRIVLSSIIALLVIVGGIFFRFGGANTGDTNSSYDRHDTKEIELGTEHTHMTIAIFIQNSPVPLGSTIYSELDEAAHFHDGEGSIIHKHAKGVTLAYFIESLGMKITPSCITIAKESYCTEGANKLEIFVNKELMNEKVSTYELRQGDKILINYGNDDEITRGLKFNSIPDLPPELYRPLETEEEI